MALFLLQAKVMYCLSNLKILVSSLIRFQAPEILSRGAKWVQHISVVLFLTYSQFSYGGDQCARALAGQSLLNHNALRAADQYKQSNARGLEEYRILLGQHFRTAISNLKPHHLYADSGSGRGVAARQLGIQFGSRVLMINPQDYSHLLDSFYLLRERSHRNDLDFESVKVIRSSETGYPEGLITKSGLIVNIAEVSLAARVLQIEVPNQLKFWEQPTVLSESSYKKILIPLIRRISLGDEFAELMAQYEVGLSEEILLKYKGKVHLLTDVYAAFYYSPHRLKVLKSFFESLAEGGRAFVYLGEGIGLPEVVALPSSKNQGPYKGDEVLLLDGTTTTLLEWLATRYPQIFSYYKVPGTPGWVLEIQHPKGFDLPDLERRLLLNEASYYQFREDGFVVPKLSFRERVN